MDRTAELSAREAGVATTDPLSSDHRLLAPPQLARPATAGGGRRERQSQDGLPEHTPPPLASGAPVDQAAEADGVGGRRGRNDRAALTQTVELLAYFLRILEARDAPPGPVQPWKRLASSPPPSTDDVAVPPDGNSRLDRRLV